MARFKSFLNSLIAVSFPWLVTENSLRENEDKIKEVFLGRKLKDWVVEESLHSIPGLTRLRYRRWVNDKEVVVRFLRWEEVIFAVFIILL